MKNNSYGGFGKHGIQVLNSINAINGCIKKASKPQNIPRNYKIICTDITSNKCKFPFPSKYSSSVTNNFINIQYAPESKLGAPGFDPGTSRSAVGCSTTELCPLYHNDLVL